MDRWLANIEADQGAGSLAAKVVRNRPADAVDACWIAGRKVTDMSTCRTAFPYYGAPRIAAGGPLTNDTLKCRLKALAPADYGATFTVVQWARLQQAFPTGVCDWTRRGIDQQRGLTWMTFAGGPGGEPLGPPPTSQPLG